MSRSAPERLRRVSSRRRTRRRTSSSSSTFVCRDWGMASYPVPAPCCTGSRAPVLVLTRRDDEVDKVIGVKLGADDYLTKPYGLRELMS